MSILPLATHTVTIKRHTYTPVEIGDPQVTTVIIAQDLPCRFDRGHGRQITNVMKSNRVTGRLFLDPAIGVVPLELEEKDVFIISGETGEYTIDSLDRVFAYNTFHHWEVDLVDNKNL